MTLQRRVKLKEGEQRKIVLDFAARYGSLIKTSSIIGIPYPTLKKYAQEKLLLPEDLFKSIIKELEIKEQLEKSYLEANWGTKKGGKLGIAYLEKNYSDLLPLWRKKAIKIARLTSPVSKTKEIKIPSLNDKLAEFVGIYLGDGTFSKYVIKISGDRRYDLYYFNYINSLILDLFNIDGKIVKEKRGNSLDLIIQSKKVCDFFRDFLGFQYGNKIKNRTIIPNLILSKKQLSIACLRGLIDTDGSISRRGINGSQFCIQFSSHNKLLSRQVFELGRNLGIFTFGDNYGSGTNRWENIVNYFKLVGSSNLRHIVRFRERLNQNVIYQRDVVDYYEKDFYKGLKMPFKLAP